MMNPDRFTWGDLVPEIMGAKGKAKSVSSVKYDVDEKPKLEATTLWHYPRQSYGKLPKGNNKYAGVTPAFIIYNLVKRYTEHNNLVVDPMAGSGTTLDVCREEGRRCIAYDIVPAHPDVIPNDARKIPLQDNSVDLVFIDSPYGDNITYNAHEKNIGRISAEMDEFYQDLEMVMSECHRILKPGKVLGWLIGDQWVKKKFTPVGFNVYQGLCKYFETLDIISVARRSQTSNNGIWYNRALRFNFYLRGFKYLFIMRKPEPELKTQQKRIVRWSKYSRQKPWSPSHVTE
jgi:DNA modification methylase